MLAGVGLTVQPEFIVWRDVASGRLRPTMPDWTVADTALNLAVPPGKRSRRVTAVMDFLTQRLVAAPWAVT